MRNKTFRSRLLPVLMAVFLMLLVGACSSSSSGGGTGQTFGVVNLSNVGTIGILTGDLSSTGTQTLSTVYLKGELGSFGGGLFDVVISPDGRTTAVTNFGDSTVHFIDTSDPSAPVSKETVSIDFFAEDMAMTPDGSRILVTDGGFSSSIAVVDVVSRALVTTFTTTVGPQFESVAVAPDGQTVLAADYWNREVHVLTLASDGALSLVSSISVSAAVWDSVDSSFVDTFAPVNVTISPDGKTAIVAGAADTWQDVAGTIPADLVFPVLKITGPGAVELSGMVTIPFSELKGSQSIVFNPAGTKAYAMCTQPNPYPMPIDPAYPGPMNVIQVLDVTAPGEVSETLTRIPVEIYGRSQMYGVDTLAIDNPGKYLYVSNPTQSGASDFIQVVDLDTNTVVDTIHFAPIDTAISPDPPDFQDPIPTGIAFWHP